MSAVSSEEDESSTDPGSSSDSDESWGRGMQRRGRRGSRERATTPTRVQHTGSDDEDSDHVRRSTRKKMRVIKYSGC